MYRNHKKTLRVWEKANNRKKPEGWHIHHIDGVNTNDVPENLICVTSENHAKIHLELYNKYGNNKDAWAYNRLTKGNKVKGFKLTEEHKEKLRGKRKGGHKLSKEHIEAIRERMKGSSMLEKSKVKLSTPIICTHIETGKDYKFYGQRKASLVLDLNYKCVNNVLKGRSKTHKGYTIKYL